MAPPPDDEASSRASDRHPRPTSEVWRHRGLLAFAVFTSILTVVFGALPLLANSVERGVDPALAERMNGGADTLPFLIAEPTSTPSKDTAEQRNDQWMSDLSAITNVEQVIPQRFGHFMSGDLSYPANLIFVLYSEVPGLSPAPGEGEDSDLSLDPGQVLLPSGSGSYLQTDDSGRATLTPYRGFVDTNSTSDPQKPVSVRSREDLIPFDRLDPPTELQGYAREEDLSKWLKDEPSVKRRYLIQVSDPLDRSTVAEQVENLGVAVYGQERMLRPPYVLKLRGLEQWKINFLVATAALAIIAGMASMEFFTRRRRVAAHGIGLAVAVIAAGFGAAAAVAHYWGGGEFLWLPSSIRASWPDFTAVLLSSGLVIAGFTAGVVLRMRAPKLLS